jgi:hypothetical protein
MSGSTQHLDTISVSQASKEITANALFDAGSPATLFGRRVLTCVGLTWGYYGGTANVGGVPTTIANGTVTLTASDTNYVEANSSGVVSVNLVGFTAGAYPLYEILTNASSVVGYTDKRMSPVPLGSDISSGTTPVAIQAACSDRVTALTVGRVLTFRIPHPMVLTSVRFSLEVASSSGAVQLDILREGDSPTESIFSTKPTIDANETTTQSAATPSVLAGAALSPAEATTLADDEEIHVEVLGAGTGAMGLVMTMLGTRTP